MGILSSIFEIHDSTKNPYAHTVFLPNIRWVCEVRLGFLNRLTSCFLPKMVSLTDLSSVVFDTFQTYKRLSLEEALFYLIPLIDDNLLAKKVSKAKSVLDRDHRLNAYIDLWEKYMKKHHVIDSLSYQIFSLQSLYLLWQKSPPLHSVTLVCFSLDWTKEFEDLVSNLPYGRLIRL